MVRELWRVRQVWEPRVLECSRGWRRGPSERGRTSGWRGRRLWPEMTRNAIEEDLLDETHSDIYGPDAVGSMDPKGDPEIRRFSPVAWGLGTGASSRGSVSSISRVGPSGPATTTQKPVTIPAQCPRLLAAPLLPVSGCLSSYWTGSSSWHASILLRCRSTRLPLLLPQPSCSSQRASPRSPYLTSTGR